MEIELLQSLAKAAGIGGIALGVLLLVIKYILAKAQPSGLSRTQTSALLNRTLLAAWSVAILGMGAWALETMLVNRPPPGIEATRGVATGGDIKGSQISIKNSGPDVSEHSDRETFDKGGIRAHQGVAAGRDISGSKIDIGNASGPAK